MSNQAVKFSPNLRGHILNDNNQKHNYVGFEALHGEVSLYHHYLKVCEIELFENGGLQGPHCL